MAQPPAVVLTLTAFPAAAAYRFTVLWSSERICESVLLLRVALLLPEMKNRRSLGFVGETQNSGKSVVVLGGKARSTIRVDVSFSQKVSLRVTTTLLNTPMPMLLMAVLQALGSQGMKVTSPFLRQPSGMVLMTLLAQQTVPSLVVILVTAPEQSMLFTTWLYMMVTFLQQVSKMAFMRAAQLVPGRQSQLLLPDVEAQARVEKVLMSAPLRMPSSSTSKQARLTTASEEVVALAALKLFQAVCRSMSTPLLTWLQTFFLNSLSKSWAAVSSAQETPLPAWQTTSAELKLARVVGQLRVLTQELMEWLVSGLCTKLAPRSTLTSDTVVAVVLPPNLLLASKMM